MSVRTLSPLVEGVETIPAGVFAWDRALRDSESPLPIAAIALGWLIKSYCDADGSGGVFVPGTPTLARKLGVSEDTIRRARGVLLDAGWLQKIGGGTGRDRLRYQLTIPVRGSTSAHPQPEGQHPRDPWGSTDATPGGAPTRAIPELSPELSPAAAAASTSMKKKPAKACPGVLIADDGTLTETACDHGKECGPARVLLEWYGNPRSYTAGELSAARDLIEQMRDEGLPLHVGTPVFRRFFAFAREPDSGTPCLKPGGWRFYFDEWVEADNPTDPVNLCDLCDHDGLRWHAQSFGECSHNPVEHERWKERCELASVERAERERRIKECGRCSDYFFGPDGRVVESDVLIALEDGYSLKCDHSPDIEARWQEMKADHGWVPHDGSRLSVERLLELEDAEGDPDMHPSVFRSLEIARGKG